MGIDVMAAVDQQLTNAEKFIKLICHYRLIIAS